MGSESAHKPWLDPHAADDPHAVDDLVLFMCDRDVDTLRTCGYVFHMRQGGRGLVGEREGVGGGREGRQGFWERLVGRRVSGRGVVRGYLFLGGSANLA